MSLPARLLISGLLLAVVVWWVGIAKVLTSFATLDPKWLALMVLSTLVFVALGAGKVEVLTVALLPGISKVLVVSGYLCSFAWGVFAPGKLGELTYAHYLSKGGGSLGVGLAVVVLDKAITFSLFGLTGSLGLLLYLGGREALAVGSTVMLLLAAGALAVRHRALRVWVRQTFLRSREAQFAGFSESLEALVRGHRPALLANGVLTLLRIVVLGFTMQAGFRAFGVDPDLLSVVMIVAMVQITSWIPITISGLGLTHGAAAVLFSNFCGLDKAVVVDVFLVGSILTYLLGAVILGTVRQRID